MIKGGASLLFLAAQGTRGLLSGCTTTMQFDRPRTVERRLPASNAGSKQQNAASTSTAAGGASREDPIASVAQATRRGEGIAAKGNGSTLGETDWRAEVAGERGAWAAAAGGAVAGGGARQDSSGSAMQSLRHVRGD